MTVTELSNITKILLLRHKRVQIPSMGTLLLENIPSQIINDGTAITPPCCKIHFDSSEADMDFSDSILVKEYAASKDITSKKAEEEVRSLVMSLKKELLENSHLSFPEFGRLLFSDNSTFTFEPHPSLETQAESFGLESLPLRAMPEPESDLEPESEQEPEPKQENLQEVADNEPQVEQEAEQGAEAEPEKANKRKLPLSLIIVLSIIGLIVLLVLVVVVFKEELTPLLERILYSKEELQFLRENGL